MRAAPRSPSRPLARLAPRLDVCLLCAWNSLSHIWATGQDQCAIIKRQLCVLLPGVKIFLDVRRCTASIPDAHANMPLCNA